MKKHVTIKYSNKGLRFWEAGCTWIENGDATIQLRTCFKAKERYLGLISKKELLAHEMVHAMRAHLNEPRFEEVLAYQTSSLAFRRYFGPFFRTPRESLLFMVALLVTPFFWPLPTLLVGVGLLRLVRTQRTYAKARKNRGFEELLSMTDKEIEAASQE
ncbi:MAG: hypothetical protein H7A36_07535 [Chlamydiales bacterium]|nr:hypothetical protein [Chlamydiales bacterium]